MAVITTQSGGGGGLLGGLGSLFSLGGMLIPGMQWMAPLGMGMSGIDSVISGNPQGMGQIMQMAAMNKMMGNWTNPASGNLSLPGGMEAYDDSLDPATYNALQKKGYQRF
jgi:hypothetical protein